MPTITVTTSHTGDNYYQHQTDSGTTADAGYTYPSYPSYGEKIIHKLRVPRKPTLDEILFDEDLEKFDEIEITVNWPGNIQDWNDANKWTYTTTNNTTSY